MVVFGEGVVLPSRFYVHPSRISHGRYMQESLGAKSGGHMDVSRPN